VSDKSRGSVPKITHDFGELRTPSLVLRAVHVRLLIHSTALTQDHFSDFFDFPHVIMNLPMLSTDSSIIWSIDNGRADGRGYRRYVV
jgi:hypothetical protein